VILGDPVPAKALTSAQRTTGLASTGTTTTARATTSAKPAKTSGDAAVADPAPQTDGAVADVTRTATPR
jgi:hypothetical protein